MHLLPFYTSMGAKISCTFNLLTYLEVNKSHGFIFQFDEHIETYFTEGYIPGSKFSSMETFMEVFSKVKWCGAVDRDCSTRVPRQLFIIAGDCSACPRDGDSQTVSSFFVFFVV